MLLSLVFRCSSLLCDLPRRVVPLHYLARGRVRERTDAASATTEATNRMVVANFFPPQHSPYTNHHDHEDTGSRSKSPPPAASCSSESVAYTITSYSRCCILRDITTSSSSPIDRGSIAHELFHHPPNIDYNFYFATATTVSSSFVPT